MPNLKFLVFFVVGVLVSVWLGSMLFPGLSVEGVALIYSGVVLIYLVIGLFLSIARMDNALSDLRYMLETGKALPRTPDANDKLIETYNKVNKRLRQHGLTALEEKYWKARKAKLTRLLNLSE